MTVFFRNDSLLPIQCVKTFGVSAKETDSPIGYFGTGLKYAIAVLLREGCEIELFIEGERFSFRVERQAVRNKEFDFIYMNDELMPFTTELGKNWKLWQAYRELYSNCKDEGGEIGCVEPGELETQAHGTLITVIGLDEIHEARGEFVLTSTPLHAIDGLEIHEPTNGKSGIFYKGIRVLDLKARYSYNVLTELMLTEDRTVSQWQVDCAFTRALTQTSDTDAVLAVLTVEDEGLYETKIDWQTHVTPSAEFMRLVNKLKKKHHYLGAYYDRHYPSFISSLGSSLLSNSAKRALSSLKKGELYQPKELHIAAMPEDYKIVGEAIILKAELLTNRKRLRLAYAIACARMKHKATGYGAPSDYEVIAKYLLGRIEFAPAESKGLAKKKKAA